MILDDERLAQVRENAAFAIREFSEASGTCFDDVCVTFVATGMLAEQARSSGGAA